MVERNLVVKNKTGLHARPAAILAQAAMKCDSEITIVTPEKTINPKSILSIMAAAIKKGTEIELQCEGTTEKEDLEKLAQLIESGLGE